MAEQILCRRLNNGVLIPTVSLGTWQLRPDDPQAASAIEHALSCGYRGIDTAWVYGNEEMIGSLLQGFKIADRSHAKYQTIKLISHPRSKDENVLVSADEFKASFNLPHQMPPTDDREIFVTTKIWIAYYTPEGIEAQVAEHLSRFGRNTIDLVLLHWPGMHTSHRMRPTTVEEMQSDQFETRKTCWLKLEELYWAKKLRAIGVSNYLFKHLNQLCSWIKSRKEAGDTKALYPMVDQFELSVFLHPSPELVALCAEHNIMITSYSTLGSSANANRNSADERLTQIAQKYRDENNNALTPQAVMLRWAVESGYAILPRSSNLDRISDNYLNSLYRFQLSDEDMTELNKLNENRRSLPCPDEVG